MKKSVNQIWNEAPRKEKLLVKVFLILIVWAFVMMIIDFAHARKDHEQGLAETVEAINVLHN